MAIVVNVEIYFNKVFNYLELNKVKINASIILINDFKI